MANGHAIQNKILKKVLVSDYDQTFYINDEDIEKNKLAVSEFRKEGKRLTRGEMTEEQKEEVISRTFHEQV